MSKEDLEFILKTFKTMTDQQRSNIEIFKNISRMLANHEERIRKLEDLLTPQEKKSSTGVV